MTGTRDVRHVVLTLAFLTLVALLGGCGSTPQPPQERADGGPPWITAEAVAAEYDERAAELDLRPGTSWPEDPTPPDAFDGEQVRYEVGYGHRAAEFDWYCSWASGAVAVDVSPRLRRAALREALRIRGMGYFTASLNKRNQHYFGAVLDRARSGHLAPLARDVRINCADTIG